VDGVGSPRRCGGQGDVLAGALGTFLAWARNAERLRGGNGTGAAGAVGGEGGADPDRSARTVLAAAYGASLVTRSAAALAFAQHGRAMTTPDLIAQLGRGFQAAFPDSLFEAAGDDEEGGGSDEG
jgi:ATP-dependent NAD(P)H-hydrate dehydratase